MLRCESLTQNHEPYAYGALNAQGKLCALLVAIRVSTLSGFVSRMAARSIFYAEPIGLDTQLGYQAVQQLVRQHDEHMRRRTLFSEVRPIFLCPPVTVDPLVKCGYEKIGYRNYELRLNAGVDELFLRMDAKRRNNVRSSIRKGLTVEQVDATEGTNTLYDLLSVSHSNSKVPFVDRSLFEAVANELPDSMYRILIAKYQGDPVAAACFLSFKKRVFCWYAGTRRVPGIAATSRLFWEAIKLHSILGFEVFDLAGAGWEGEDYGPGKFKSKFGGQLIHGSRYRKVYAPLKLRLAELIYGRMRSWLSTSSSVESPN
jgi:serine/alanine adding enzyme